MAHLLGRIFPTDHEQGKTLIKKIPDKTGLLTQIKNIEFIDPWRDQDDGNGIAGRSRRTVLNESHQLIAEDNETRCGCDIDADFEFPVIDHLHQTITTLHIFKPVIITLPEALSPAFQKFLNCRRIGPEIIGGGHGVDDLTGPEKGSLFIFFFQTRHHLDRIPQPAAVCGIPFPGKLGITPDVLKNIVFFFEYLI